jgi:two-component system, NarL family, response regulator DevR
MAAGYVKVMTSPAGTTVFADRALVTEQGPVSDRSPLSTLTERERNVLDLIAVGLTNREIAAEMFLSEKTVKNYVTRMLLKCNVRNRTEAAILVLQSSPGAAAGERSIV